MSDKPHTPSDANDQPPQPDNTAHDEGVVTDDVKTLAEEALRMSQAQRPPAERSPTPFEPGCRLEFIAGEDAPPIVVDALPDDVKIGRGDTVADYVPEVDLTPYGAYRLGVSRQHARLYLDGRYLKLMDLGSRNGTQINGRSLTPEESCAVADGDEVRFANMKLTLRIVREGEG